MTDSALVELEAGADRRYVWTAPISIGGGHPGLRLRCLIVDDNLELAENIAEIIQWFGEDAVVATSGEEAIGLLKLSFFHLLISDFRMPGGMNGAELIREAHLIQAGLTAFIVSAYLDGDDHVEIGPEACCAVLEKPFRVGQLQALLRAARDDLKTTAD